MKKVSAVEEYRDECYRNYVEYNQLVKSDYVIATESCEAFIAGWDAALQMCIMASQCGDNLPTSH